MPVLLSANKQDLGAVVVRRILPNVQQQMIGPFIFFDHFGPVTFAAGQGFDVRPHPHIGIATITYLFDGSILHRDSLGNTQEIVPGDINWMVAGSGIVHSERETKAVRQREHRLHGLQLWIALPDGQEAIDPLFRHYPRQDLPHFVHHGITIKLMIGSIWGYRSPVAVYSEMLYADFTMPQGTSATLPIDTYQYGVYVIAGELSDQAGKRYKTHDFLYFDVHESIVLTANQESKIVVVGGEPFNSQRYLWWNFVASSKERIAMAKLTWFNGEFATIPGENDFIPLP